MLSGNHFFFVIVFVAIFSSTSTSADQKVPFGVVDFQQYTLYKHYLEASAKHKVFVVSEHMQPGSGYGWGDTIKIARQYAKNACKEKFRWPCKVVSVDGKIQGKKRNIPTNIKQPVSSGTPNVEVLSDEIKNLFKGYTFTTMYTEDKSHKAYAVNNFGATGQGHGRGYITIDIAKERALYHCNQDATRRKVPLSRQQPCYVVAINDQLLNDNINKVLNQKELITDLVNPGDVSEKWHGKYLLDLSKMAATLGVKAGDDIYYLFGNSGFQIKQGDLITASGTYKKSGNVITLDYITGEKDPLNRKLRLTKNQQSLTFDDKKYSNIIFNKQ